MFRRKDTQPLIIHEAGVNNQAQVYNSLGKCNVSLSFLPSVTNQHQNALCRPSQCPPGNQCCGNLKELTKK